MPVCTIPGETMLTRIFCRASSLAKTRAYEVSAALNAAYKAVSGTPKREDTDETKQWSHSSKSYSSLIVSEPTKHLLRN